MKTKNVFLIYASLIFVLLAACGVPTPQPTPTPTQPPPTATQPAPKPIGTVAAAPDTSVRYHFVTNKLLVPTTQQQSQAFALNLDGDPQQTPDNLFGNLLTMLLSASPGLQLQSNVDQAINAGEIVTLHVIQASDPMNANSASWSIFLGQKPQSAPKFDGADAFTLDPAAPTNTLISGSLVNGHFSGGPGAVRIQMALMGQPVEIDLVGVRIEADVNAQGCTNGKLGGGITVDEFHGKFLPALAGGLNQAVKADKTAANTILSVFDTDQDGAVSSAELENNLLLKLVTSPDVDLLDASGKFNPRQDGVNDSLSIGLGFTCVPATFTAPGD